MSVEVLSLSHLRLAKELLLTLGQGTRWLAKPKRNRGRFL